MKIALWRSPSEGVRMKPAQKNTFGVGVAVIRPAAALVPFPPAGGSEASHIQMAFRLRGELDDCPAGALDGFVARHELLRTTFGVEDGDQFQQIGPADVGLPLKRGDLTAATDMEGCLLS